MFRNLYKYISYNKNTKIKINIISVHTLYMYMYMYVYVYVYDIYLQYISNDLIIIFRILHSTYIGMKRKNLDE